jgi:RNA recognition motif-containing protein
MRCCVVFLLKDVFVANIPRTASAKALEDALSAKFGPCWCKSMPVRPVTLKPADYAFVQFINDTDADKALADSTGVTLGPNVLRVLPVLHKAGKRVQTKAKQRSPSAGTVASSPHNNVPTAPTQPTASSP